MMKQLVILVMLLVGTGAHAFSQKSVSELKGTWRAANGAGLEVQDSTVIFLLFGEDRKKAVAPRWNLEADPSSLDFTVRIDEKDMPLQTLFRILPDGRLQWQIFETTRPADFTSAKGEILILKKE